MIIDTYDCPHIDIKNIDLLIESTKYWKNNDAKGRTLIHPSHIEHVNNIYKPKIEEIDSNIIKIIK